MNTLRRWISYDTFKLIVALILLALLLILLFQRPALPQPANTGGANQALAGAVQQPSSTAAVVPPTSASTPQPASAQVEATPTTPPPNPTATTAALTPTEAAAPTAEATVEATVEATAAPTVAPSATATPQPQAPAQSASADCPLAAPPRLAVGKQAQVVANLNLRKEAGMDKPIMLISLPNSKVDVTGGPVCLPYQNGAYLWWNVKTRDGTTGWSAEASLSKKFYFLQPVP